MGGTLQRRPIAKTMPPYIGLPVLAIILRGFRQIKQILAEKLPH